MDMFKFLGKTVCCGTVFLVGAAAGAAATLYLVVSGMRYLDELDAELEKGDDKKLKSASSKKGA